MVVTSDSRVEDVAPPRAVDDRTLAGAWRRPLVLGAFAACVTLAIVQLLTIGRVELMFDEAYYALWSRNLAWGYLDHPPMVAAWVRASTSLFGPSEFGVRALDALSMIAAPGVIAWMAWRLFDSVETAALAALMWVAMPLAAAAFLVTPDTPLTIFWTLALAGLIEIWRTRRAAWWLFVGVAAGLALLTKFTGAFFGAGVVLALLTTPSLRRWLASPAPYLAAAVSLAIFAPFVVWNAEHGWMTFRFQFARVPPHRFAPQFLAQYVAMQIGLMNPLTFCAAAAGVGATLAARGRPLAPADEARRVLLATIVPAIAYFALHALHDAVQFNWLAPIYPTVAILAAEAVARARAATGASSRWRRFVAATGRYAPLLGLAGALFFDGQAATKALPLGSFDPTARIGDWGQLTQEVDRIARRENAQFIIVGSYIGGYEEASLLTYYGDPALPVLSESDPDRWLFEPPPPPSLFSAPGIGFGRLGWELDAALAKRFRKVEEIARVARPDHDRPSRQYAIYRVEGLIAP